MLGHIHSHPELQVACGSQVGHPWSRVSRIGMCNVSCRKWNCLGYNLSLSDLLFLIHLGFILPSQKGWLCWIVIIHFITISWLAPGKVPLSSVVDIFLVKTVFGYLVYCIQFLCQSPVLRLVKLLSLNMCGMSYSKLNAERVCTILPKSYLFLWAEPGTYLKLYIPLSHCPGELTCETWKELHRVEIW